MCKNILLTGASGFLGGHLIQEIQKRDPEIKIYALIRNEIEWKKLKYNNIVKIIGDFNDLKWINTCPNFDVIIHAAAIVKHSRRNSKEQIDFNVNSTIELTKLATKNNSRLIFVSSSGTVACGKKEKWIDELSDYAQLNWPYYVSKITAEKKAIELSKNTNIKLTIFRPSVMLGPGDHKFRSTGNILKFLNKKFPFLIEGNITFCDIRDVSKSIINCMYLEKPRLIYNLPGHSMPIDKFFNLCEEISGVKKPKFTLPIKIAYPISKVVEEVFFRLKKHSPLPDPVILEMAARNWDIQSLFCEEVNYKLTDSKIILEDTIKWIKCNI